MKVSNHSSVPVYTVSGSSTARPLPEWLARKRRRSLKSDADYTSRVELLQDFEFEEASQCIRVSSDGEWVMSTGTYKPQIHTHYLPHLSLSFARHTINLNIKFLLLSSDYSKSLHLQADRSLEFHTPSGCHYSTRIPRYGRDLKLVQQAAEALIPASGIGESGHGEVYRLNLEVGKFMRPFEIDLGDEYAFTNAKGALQGDVNVDAVSSAAVAYESHNLLAFGTTRGTVELWDPRSKDRIAILRSPLETMGNAKDSGITCLEFDSSGLGLATGSQSGLINLYDLRNPQPLVKKDQGYGYPIQDIIYLQSSSSRSQTLEPKILTSDKRIIKIWDVRDGTPWTSVEPSVDMNAVAWCKDSGMLLTANEGRQQHSFFIPQLGPAPRWCSFLDNLVEEMAEDPNDPNAYDGQKTGEIYDNFKFLTTVQLESLNLSHLIGTTNLLRPYMHGFFVAQRLYEEAKLIANPFVWEEQRNKHMQEKIDHERESRIRSNKRIDAKVNKSLAAKLQEQKDKEDRRVARRLLRVQEQENGAVDGDDKSSTVPASTKTDLLSDPRFSQLFDNADFAIDEHSREFKLLNPSTKPTAAVEEGATYQRKMTAAEEEEEERGQNLDSSAEDEEEDDVSSDQFDHNQDSSFRNRRNISDEQKSNSRISTSSYRRSGHRAQQLPEGKRREDGHRLKMSSSSQKRAPRDRAFGARAVSAKAEENHIDNHNAVGEKHVTFAPQPKVKKSVDMDVEMKSHRNDKNRRRASGNVFRRM